MKFGNSLAVQWLGLGAFTAVTQVESLVWELRSCKPHGTAKKNPKKQKQTTNKQNKKKQSLFIHAMHIPMGELNNE